MMTEPQHTQPAKNHPTVADRVMEFLNNGQPFADGA